MCCSCSALARHPGNMQYLKNSLFSRLILIHSTFQWMLTSRNNDNRTKHKFINGGCTFLWYYSNTNDIFILNFIAGEGTFWWLYLDSSKWFLHLSTIASAETAPTETSAVSAEKSFTVANIAAVLVTQAFPFKMMALWLTCPCHHPNLHIWRTQQKQKLNNDP